MISLAQIRARIQTLGPDAERNRIVPLVDAVVADFERQTSRLWKKRENHTQRLRLKEWHIRGGLVWLELYPVESLALVEWEADQALDDAEDVGEDEIDCDPSLGRVKRIKNEWLPNVQATVTGGYDEDTLPPEVREALLNQVVFQYRRTHPDRIHVAAEVQGESGAKIEYLPGYEHPTYTRCIRQRTRRAR